MLMAEFLDHSRCPMNISGAWECTSVVSHLLCVHRTLGSFLSVCVRAHVCVYTRTSMSKKMQAQIQAVFSSKRSVINPGPDPGPPTAPPPVYRDQSPQPLPPFTETRAQWTQREPEFQGLLDSSIPLFSGEKASPAPSLGLHCHSLKYSFDYENISH